MYKLFYAGNALLLYPVLAMFLFMAVFLLAAYRAWRLREPAQLDSLRSLPLQDDQPLPPQGGHHV